MAVLSWVQVAEFALAGGFGEEDAVTATAITGCESSRDATIVQAGQPYASTGWGLWQITPGDSEPQFGINNAMLNPLNNAKAAHAKWSAAGGFTPWTTYTSGCYQQYLGAAAAAVAAARHLSPAQARALAAAAARGAHGSPGGGGDLPNWAPKVRQAAIYNAAQARMMITSARAIRRLHPHLPTPRRRPLPAQSVVWSPGHQEEP